MPRPIQPRLPPVIISDHAFGRWLLRGQGREPKTKNGLAALITMLLYNHLRAGGVEIKNLGLELDLGGPLRAVLRLGELGWICTTIRDISEPREEKVG